MTSWILVFAFTFADGRQVVAEQHATHLEKYAPVRELAMCEDIARIRADRLNAVIEDNPHGLIRRVEAHCKQAKPAKMPRRNKGRRLKNEQ